jgi:hypothetical protein
VTPPKPKPRTAKGTSPAGARPAAQSGLELGVSLVPTLTTVLEALRPSRLLDLCRVLGCDVRGAELDRRGHIQKLVERSTLAVVLGELGRDELRAVCRRHGLDATSTARATLARAILDAAGVQTPTRPATASFRGAVPTAGQLVHLRRRQWMVDHVARGTGGESPLVRLVCLDDDDPGRELEVLWDLELGAEVVAPEAAGLGESARLDPPRRFGAYLHALEWSAVSAADATRFQAPFRAGIKLMAHQLTPLMKALELPRANVFIADDVGLGKTIEAGLVLQELILRQQAEFVLVVCPASVTLQWQTEMQRRFGLRFEVMTRELIARRRQERGFGTNPWSTFHRFIVSHAFLRRPEHQDPLLQLLGERARKSLLILDEAHAAAPASASKYAVDTEITRTVRTLARRFDNRLFLSATPHNGHSNSFSALLEILDPVRFTRGVPVEGKKDLEAVMVRRLKRDLRQLGVERFPRRILAELALTHHDGAWSVDETAYDAETGEARPGRHADLGAGPPLDLDLARALARYTALCAPASGQGRLPFINLQQRLLSSPEAFARTLEAHAQGVARRGGPLVSVRRPSSQLDLELHGEDEEVTSAEDEARVRDDSRALPAPNEEAQGLLSELRALAQRARRQPDAKTQALLDWLRAHLCPALGRGDSASRAERAWTERRVILFTEYADTKRYLVELLSAAAAHTERGDERILQLHGGMGEDARAEVQRAFTTEPSRHPVRILVATDAAREGVNLQAHCADLFHVDIPWNPSRLEQRNGRIDRTLQPADEVRCHYFVYPQRPEDLILSTVVRKVETVQRELGSLGAVLLGQLERALAGGLSLTTHAEVEAVGQDARTETVDAELGARRSDLDAVRADVERAGRRLEASRRALEVHPDSLRGVVEVGLGLSGAGPLTEAAPTSDGRPAYTLPALDASWAATLDTLRPPRGRDESFSAWRQRPPRPVTFHPLSRLSEDAEQLHLAHPLVRRILDRFLAQGFGAHDLSRVTALVAPDESVTRVVAFARLSIFGPGAARLHDELVPIAAPWTGDAATVKPYKDRATAVSAVVSAKRLLATGAATPNATIEARIRAHAGALFAALWPHLEAEADAVATTARQGLVQRARREADDMRGLIQRQQLAIDKAEKQLRQVELFKVQERDQRRQLERDLEHLGLRRAEASLELESEPRAIEALYEVRMQRLTPVGMVVAWAEAMT